MGKNKGCRGWQQRTPVVQSVSDLNKLCRLSPEGDKDPHYSTTSIHKTQECKVSEALSLFLRGMRGVKILDGSWYSMGCI